MPVDSGLAGLIAAETVLSHADGPRGILWMRGHTLDQLVADFGYDGAVGALWEGFAGTGLDRATMRARLGAGRVKAFGRLGDWLHHAAARSPVEGARLALASLPEDSAPDEILATLPVAATALLRQRRGKPPVAPDPARGTADDLLHMAHDAPAPPIAPLPGRCMAARRVRRSTCSTRRRPPATSTPGPKGSWPPASG